MRRSFSFLSSFALACSLALALALVAVLSTNAYAQPRPGDTDCGYPIQYWGGLWQCVQDTPCPPSEPDCTLDFFYFEGEIIYFCVCR